MAEQQQTVGGNYLPGVLIGLLAGGALWLFTYKMLLLAR